MLHQPSMPRRFAARPYNLEIFTYDLKNGHDEVALEFCERTIYMTPDVARQAAMAIYKLADTVDAINQQCEPSALIGA